MKTLVNPSSRPVQVVLSTGETLTMKPFSLAEVDAEVVRAEYVLPAETAGLRSVS
jgi:hypothetical protein